MHNSMTKDWPTNQISELYYQIAAFVRRHPILSFWNCYCACTYFAVRACVW